MRAVFDFAGIRAEFEVPEGFSPAALAEAERAAATPPPAGWRDVTDLPLVTLDPPGSRDLDQAVHIARDGAGYRVSYAIADVASVVTPGGALDDAVWPRGVTVYCPDLRVPLHPAVLSEGAASLLPDQVRRAALWELSLDAAGEVVDARVGRALVRSVAQLDYPSVQAAIDSDGAATVHPALALLPEVGRLRQAIARARHAIELNLPDQEVIETPAGWALTYRLPLPVEAWNAEISLLTGLSAARMMLDAGVGLLRTLPPAEESDVRRLRRIAPSLGVDWAEGTPVGDVLAGLDPADPGHAAFTEESTSLLRGAGYTPFAGGEIPEQPEHAAIGAPYAHVTAPLRRLADRYAAEICLAASAGDPIPGWVLERLEDVPAAMATAVQRTSSVERACVDLVEAHLLAGRIGEEFDAVVVDAGEERGTVVVSAVAARSVCEGRDLPLGERIRVRLTEADPATRRVRFRVA
ncbi:MAG: RNB domain-containing ribonuclease [Geodermatophilaceae bacterium]|nr:RNB domain-containing ribonuclease [Geodermatophilaceae bacterium]